MVSRKQERQSGREIYEGSMSGAQDRPFIPRLRSDLPLIRPLPRSLDNFREEEGSENREKRLHGLWKKIPHPHRERLLREQDSISHWVPVNDHVSLTRERAENLTKMYEDELLRECAEEGDTSGPVTWKDFRKYADYKEAELWHIFHDELDLDGNGRLDADELGSALSKAEINLGASTLSEFMTFLTSSPHSHAVSFSEFRNFLLLLPRRATTAEIYRYYEVRKYMGDDGRGGAARVTMEGDVSISGEDRPPIHPIKLQNHLPPVPIDHQLDDQEVDHYDEVYFDKDEGDEEHPHSTSFRFLLAGGIAGAVSRTTTAPFDRLKVFLITRSPELSNVTLVGTTQASQAATQGFKAIGGAITQIYAEGGVRAFWVGNGLSVAKIFPESAIKFFSYETAKRFFAQYVDRVEDSRDISGTSRFLSGGMGGITSQLSIYPVETLKTQMMSTTGEQKRHVISAAKRLWALGGLRAYYRGLTVGLIGVFPYAAIDMSTFEALKLAYLRSTGKDEPGMLHLLAFGSVSGGVGATSVYPLNLVRTRLQASGSSGHPQRYKNIFDVAWKTYQHEGWRGFYRGLFPTLAKVIPSVSISYVVYEHSKKK
ncbi:mitochondrial carrier [Phellopilus nigrolimitatus]|nr:mitochondrial carrier [Phellopilus nigrolimitatus]